jgi:hypothetical protein
MSGRGTAAMVPNIGAMIHGQTGLGERKGHDVT